MPYRLLADATLATHIAIVAFVIGGLLLIIAANVCRWLRLQRIVNRWWFRLLHLGAIAFVVAETWLGITCPLTTLEMWLRQQAHQTMYSGGFIEHWMQRLLYYDAPPWVFTLCYTLFGAVVVASLWLFPPQRHRSNKER